MDRMKMDNMNMDNMNMNMDNMDMNMDNMDRRNMDNMDRRNMDRRNMDRRNMDRMSNMDNMNTGRTNMDRTNLNMMNMDRMSNMDDMNMNRMNMGHRMNRFKREADSDVVRYSTMPEAPFQRSQTSVYYDDSQPRIVMQTPRPMYLTNGYSMPYVAGLRPSMVTRPVIMTYY